MLGLLELALCDMQGNLFTLSGKDGFSSEQFIKVFMSSNSAGDLDKQFSHMQWAGEAYIYSRLKEENPEAFVVGGPVYDHEALYWTGYLYRYWHYYTGENSKDILKQAAAKTMNIVYLMYHTMSLEMAIDRLKETHQEKTRKN